MRNFIIGYIVGALAAGFARSFLESRDLALLEAITEAYNEAPVTIRMKVPTTKEETSFSA